MRQLFEHKQLPENKEIQRLYIYIYLKMTKIC